MVKPEPTPSGPVRSGKFTLESGLVGENVLRAQLFSKTNLEILVEMVILPFTVARDGKFIINGSPTSTTLIQLACTKFVNEIDVTETAPTTERPWSIDVTPSPAIEVRLGLETRIPLLLSLYEYSFHVWSSEIEVVMFGRTNDPV
jgi:hypothetical protein